MKRRTRLVKSGEHLAIHPDALRSGTRQGRRAMWWDCFTRVPENERRGDVSIVHVVGALEHRQSWGDSYEAILRRVRDALSGMDMVRQAERQNRYAAWGDGEEVEVPEATPPKSLLLVIDSPGGVVSGLNETAKRIRAMAKAAGVQVVAYADEMAASAAYALSCCADEIYLPKSGILGSIGVISTMYDQSAADKKFGLRFVTITSGARKADGHPHVPLSDDAIAAEQGRVNALARQFYALVSEARGLSPKAIAGLQAGIFLGKDAVAAGLADGVASLDEVLAGLSDEADTSRTSVKQKSVAQNGTTQVASASQVRHVAPRLTHAGGTGMLVKLKAIVATLEKQLAAAPAAKRAELRRKLAEVKSDLEAATKIKKKTEEYSEETDDSEEEEAESGNETDREESDGDDDDDDDQGDDDKDEDDDETSAESEEEGGDMEEEASLSALARRVTGKTGKAAIGALAAVISEGQRAQKTVAQIQKERTSEKKAALISEALNARALVPHEAKELRSKPFSFVESFLGMRRDKKTGAWRAVVHTDDSTLVQPDQNAKGPGAGLPAAVLAEIEKALRYVPSGTDKKALREQMIADQQARHAKAAGGRY